MTVYVPLIRSAETPEVEIYCGFSPHKPNEPVMPGYWPCRIRKPRRNEHPDEYSQYLTDREIPTDYHRRLFRQLWEALYRK